MKTISLFLLLLTTQVLGFLDIEELQTINYGINIIDQPIVAGGFPEDETVLSLQSKFGQNYRCSYMDRRQEDQREMEEERVAMETGIPDLLKPLGEGACLLHTRGWWTYEFCYKNQIRQYHMEDNVITGPTIDLGRYESEEDWTKYVPKQKKHSSVSPFHSHLYVNGSVCDLTKKPRKAEVRVSTFLLSQLSHTPKGVVCYCLWLHAGLRSKCFLLPSQFSCRKGTSDILYGVDEPETCSYIFHVHTNRVCSHPYLKPVAQARPVPITCHPVLSQEDFDSYHQHEQGERH
ncbi:hypothetical protein CAPTEDRAFT_109094 [Capitella teleta]|uniref:MRH domain-containing protein n=1 Tax=Capitella teleta TaxID=283909 RepID=R7TNU3_CAPTE|nr:hypothetical protein CAPTEDRAFT_109094 [Capitella teleta]|eukprot:ELT95553.1 hypothetical protein CAPTEDRAFT_109094 [Capitella teleta]